MQLSARAKILDLLKFRNEWNQKTYHDLHEAPMSRKLYYFSEWMKRLENDKKAPLWPSLRKQYYFSFG